MPTQRITKTVVDDLVPGTTDSYRWDSELSGFGVKCTPAGRKVYLIQYRVGGRRGRTRRVTIGYHGVITAVHARASAKELLGKAHAGIDPADDRRHRSGVIVRGVLDAFVEHHVRSKLKPTTAHEYERIIKLYVPNKLKSRLLTDIGRADISAMHNGLRDRPYQANRLLAVLSKFFSWCEEQGLRPDNTNPCQRVQKFKEMQRERFLRPEELSRLGAVLRAAEHEKAESPFVIAALRLLIFTGARLGEILGLAWAEVDWELRVLRLGDSKTGRKTVHLSESAVEVLRTLPRLDGNRFVICGEVEGAHLVNLQKPWRRIRAAAGLEDVRLHDLRHTFGSVGAICGLSLPIIGGLLGHSQPQTTQRYAHLSADPLQKAADRVGASINASMDIRSDKPVHRQPSQRRRLRPQRLQVSNV